METNTTETSDSLLANYQKALNITLIIAACLLVLQCFISCCLQKPKFNQAQTRKFMVTCYINKIKKYFNRVLCLFSFAK